MSDPIENGLAQEMPVTSDGAQMDAEARDENLRPPVTESVDEQNSLLNADTNLEKTADLVENSVGQDIAEQLAMDIDMPSETKSNVDVLFGSANQGNNLVKKVDSDVKEEIQNYLGKENNGQLENGDTILGTDMKEVLLEDNQFNETPMTVKQARGDGDYHVQTEGLNLTFSFDPSYSEGDDSGTEEEQAAFMKELENFFKDRSLEFKPPKFYGEGLNCLKLWRAVTRLGGYDQVTQCKLWRQVGESFKPPKTCTTVSWSFRCFYEKALLEYEKHKVRTGELPVPVASLPEPISVDNQAANNQASGSGRARRDAAARAMQGWHSQRLLAQPHKRKKPSSLERAVKVARTKSLKPHVDSMVVDVGAPADWVKINVQRTKDCYEVYALVPGLLREEVHVQSDPAGRLIISGEPEQPNNPWGVTSFKKVITLPSRIDPHQTSAVVTLHGQLFVRAPFEQSDI